jgi:DNA-directed RNA polymerase specialized sigma24 family protein
MKNPHILIAEQYGIKYLDLNTLANKAVQYCRKAYSFWGSLTKDDLYSEAWLGILSGLQKSKFIYCKNNAERLAYLFTFARGYCTHALHRQSRMIRVPGSKLKESQPHLSLDAGNLPLPPAKGYVHCSEDLLNLVDKISLRDQARILRGDTRLSKKTLTIINSIKCHTAL